MPLRGSRWPFAKSLLPRRLMLSFVMMEVLRIVLQLLAAFGILNVWLLRRDRPTPYRGGGASNMKEEFAAYGLPGWSVGVIGTLKVLCAIGLLAGIAFPPVVDPAAAVLGILMLGAFGMHLKVKDPPLRAAPSVGLLLVCVLIVAL